jgi:hypothetical protein
VHVVFVEYVDAEAFVLIGGLVVDRHHRRLGIGRAPLDRAEVWARERGCSMVRLTSSTTRNQAHRFYENLGYTNIKTQYSFIKPLDPAAAARVRTSWFGSSIEFPNSFRAWTPQLRRASPRYTLRLELPGFQIHQPARCAS